MAACRICRTMVRRSSSELSARLTCVSLDRRSAWEVSSESPVTAFLMTSPSLVSHLLDQPGEQGSPLRHGGDVHPLFGRVGAPAHRSQPVQQRHPKSGYEVAVAAAAHCRLVQLETHLGGQLARLLI